MIKWFYRRPTTPVKPSRTRQNDKVVLQDTRHTNKTQSHSAKWHHGNLTTKKLSRSTTLKVYPMYYLYSNKAIAIAGRGAHILLLLPAAVAMATRDGGEQLVQCCCCFTQRSLISQLTKSATVIFFQTPRTSKDEDIGSE